MCYGLLRMRYLQVGGSAAQPGLPGPCCCPQPVGVSLGHLRGHLQRSKLSWPDPWSMHAQLRCRCTQPLPIRPCCPTPQAAWQLLQGASSWQAAEAALYLFSTVSLAVKTRVLAEANGGDENAVAGSAAAAAAEDRAQTHALLVALFGRVCSPEGAASMLGAHPMLAEAACRLVEHYAAWFGRTGEEPPLQGALQLLLRGLAIPQVGAGACRACAPMSSPLGRLQFCSVLPAAAASHDLPLPTAPTLVVYPLLPAILQASHTAAQGFQQLCLRCAGKIRDAGAFGWLMDTAHGALQQAGAALPIAERQLVVEGLARAAAGLPGQQLLDASARLAAPFVQAAQQACSNGAAADAAARRTLADSLRLLAAAVRHLAPVGDDRGELGAQPAAQILAAAGPTLAAVAETPAWQADREAVGAVVEVYQRAVGTAKQHGLQVGAGGVGLTWEDGLAACWTCPCDKPPVCCALNVCICSLLSSPCSWRCRRCPP